MDIEYKEIEINYPEIDSTKIFNALLDQCQEIQSTIDRAIRSLAKNDKDEIWRIHNADIWIAYDIETNLKNSGIDFSFGIDKPTGKKPSNKELALALALAALEFIPPAIESGNLTLVFYSMREASQLLGIAQGNDLTEVIMNKERTAFYISAALKRHEENHKIKADALKYYSENTHKFKSKDKAAEEIAGKIVNASFRTVRKWISEYHKNLRSAGIA